MLVSIRSGLRVRIIAGLLVSAVLSIGFLSSTTFAQAGESAANTLKVSPIRTDITVKPGDSTVVKITVTNLTSSEVHVSAIENDFVQGDETGTPSIILDANEYAPTHSLKRFMSPVESLKIPAKEAKTVGVTITVPKDAQAGGYFGALRFAPSDPDGGGQVNLSASVASLILLTVPGPVTEQLTLTDFALQQGNKAGADFRTPNDLKVAFRFENKGNIQLGPFGRISVRQGDKVIYEYDFNDKNPRDVILPDGARKWEVPLKNIGTFGRYTVNATFTYGSKNQSIDVERSFWVIPTAYIVAAIAAAIVLIGLIVGSIFFFRGRRQRAMRRRGGHRRR